MKYRKKPVVIEALRYDGTWPPVIAWLTELGRDRIPFGSRPTITRDNDDGCLYIETLEGVMQAQPGDYVIQGVHGEFYPCKPDIFAATYEPVGEQP